MDPGVSAKVSKSDIRVPERKSKVSKHESLSQAGNVRIVQIARFWQEQLGKSVIFIHAAYQNRNKTLLSLFLSINSP